MQRAVVHMPVVCNDNPCIWQTLVWCLVREVHGRGLILEMTSGKYFRILHSSWFDSGNMFMPVYRAMWKNFTRFRR